MPDPITGNNVIMKTINRQRYDESFKMNTVRTFCTSGKPVSVYAKSIGIEQSVLHRWVKKYRNSVIPGKETPGNEGNEKEVEYLKREMASVKQTVSILQTIMERAFKDKYGF
jgi:transposase